MRRIVRVFMLRCGRCTWTGYGNAGPIWNALESLVVIHLFDTEVLSLGSC